MIYNEDETITESNFVYDKHNIPVNTFMNKNCINCMQCQ